MRCDPGPIFKNLTPQVPGWQVLLIVHLLPFHVFFSCFMEADRLTGQELGVELEYADPPATDALLLMAVPWETIQPEYRLTEIALDYTSTSVNKHEDGTLPMSLAPAHLPFASPRASRFFAAPASSSRL